MRIKEELRKDKILWGECLSGALYIEDFRRMMNDLGFSDCRVISKSNITIDNAKVEEQLEGMKFYSITYRCFKLDDLEDRCEDYGQKAKYLGGIEEQEEEFFLDNSHTFKKGESAPICGNTASMLKDSRFGKYFEVDERGHHRGLFDCSKTSEVGGNKECGEGSCC